MTIHSCSYYCQRPECIKAQRDELRDRLGSMTDREIMQQALEALTAYDGTNGASQRKRVLAALRDRLAQEPNMPEQYVMVGRFMLQPHPQNGYWLTDTGTSETMQIFQPEMEQVIKKLWSQF